MALKALKITQRCRRCRKPMRNDGTDEAPIWVCNNPNCVCYVPPAPYVPDKTGDNGEEGTEDSAEE